MLSSEIQSEYLAVSTRLGVWQRDVSLIEVCGADRFTWLQGMVSNDVRMVQSGTERLQAFVLDATGHIVYDIVVTTSPFADDALLIEVPGSNAAELMQLLDHYLITEDVALALSSAGVVTLQGPAANRALNDDGLAFHIPADHSGSGGFDCFVRGGASAAAEIAGGIGAPLISVAVQELLRIEAGIPLFGAEINSSVLAPETGLGSTHISLTKGCYVGQEIVARIDSRGHTNRSLTGIVIIEGDAPARGDTISPADGNNTRDVGRVTSVADYSPAMDGRPIALGYVRHEFRPGGTRLRIGSSISLSVDLPFAGA